MKRRLSAILAADIVGYSKFVAADDEETVRRLADYRRIFDEVTIQFGGRIVNMTGDAVLAEFPNSVDAIRCAIHARESIRSANRFYPPDRRITFRIGINVGDVIDKDGQIFGDGVNIAARLESLSQPGGICVSRNVYEHVVNELSVKFEDMGQLFVKNIPSPVHAYMIAPYRGDGEDAIREHREDVARQRRRQLTIGAAIVVAMLAASITATFQWFSAR